MSHFERMEGLFILKLYTCFIFLLIFVCSEVELDLLLKLTPLHCQEVSGLMESLSNFLPFVEILVLTLHVFNVPSSFLNSCN